MQIAEPKDARHLHLNETARATTAPLACTLNATDQQDRLGQWERVLSETEHRIVADDGLVLRFRLKLDLTHAAVTLIHAELECSSFFVFQLSLDSRFMTLTVTAPGHGLAVVEQIFGWR